MVLPALNPSKGPSVTTLSQSELAPAAQGEFAASVYDAYKIYGTGDEEIRALNGVTVGLRRGEFTAIMGPSGSGKSTLLQCIAGLDELTGGRVLLGTQDITNLNPTQLTFLRRDYVGFIFQSFNLVPSLTARQNMMLPIKLGKRTLAPGEFAEVVQMVGLGNRLDHKPKELSGGQQQRVAVARALIGHPPIIFADEPTGNLDSRSSGEILQFLRNAVRSRGQTVVMVTHDPMAAAYADSVIFLADGRLVDSILSPTPDSILERMKQFGRQ